MSAAPQSISRNATVFVLTLAGYRKVQEGQNGYTCLVNRDSELDGYAVLKPTCWDRHGSATIVPLILEFARSRLSGQTVESVRQKLSSALEKGDYQRFSHTGIAYMLNGDIDRFDTETGKILSQAFPPHVMTYVPEQPVGNIENAGTGVDATVVGFYKSALGYSFFVVPVVQQ